MHSHRHKSFLCCLKLVCEGVERTLTLDTYRKVPQAGIVTSLIRLLHCIVRIYDPKRLFSLAYLDENKTVTYITNEWELRYAGIEAAGRPLRIWVVLCDTASELSCSNESDDDGSVYGNKNVMNGDRANLEECLHTTKRAQVPIAGAGTLARRDAMHSEYCFGCGESPIRGLRYVYRRNGKTTVCADCLKFYLENEWCAVAVPLDPLFGTAAAQNQ